MSRYGRQMAVRAIRAPTAMSGRPRADAVATHGRPQSPVIGGAWRRARSRAGRGSYWARCASSLLILWADLFASTIPQIHRIGVVT